MSGTPARILLVEINEDGTTGGSHQCLYDIVRQLDRTRHTPVVLFYQHNRMVPRLRELGVEVHVWERERARERPRQEDRALRRALRRPRQVIGQVAAIVRRARFLARERIDLVHLNNSPGVNYADWLPAARLARVPCITHARMFYPTPERWIWRRLMADFDRVIAISRHMAEVVRQAGTPSGRIVQIYDGIDIDALRARISREPAAVRAGVGVPADRLLVVMAGHLRPWKGQDIVIRALALLAPEVRERLVLVLAGATGLRSERYVATLHALVAEHGLGDVVRFLGERDDIPELMHAADIVVHASTTPEPFGLVVVEGMALAKPVVAANLGGPAEIVAPGTALTFDAGRPEALAVILERLAGDPAERHSLGERARERAEIFDIAHNVGAIARLYDEVLDGAR